MVTGKPFPPKVGETLDKFTKLVEQAEAAFDSREAERKITGKVTSLQTALTDFGAERVKDLGLTPLSAAVAKAIDALKKSAVAIDREEAAKLAQKVTSYVDNAEDFGIPQVVEPAGELLERWGKIKGGRNSSGSGSTSTHTREAFGFVAEIGGEKITEGRDGNWGAFRHRLLLSLRKVDGKERQFTGTEAKALHEAIKQLREGSDEVTADKWTVRKLAA